MLKIEKLQKTVTTGKVYAMFRYLSKGQLIFYSTTSILLIVAGLMAGLYLTTLMLWVISLFFLGSVLLAMFSTIMFMDDSFCAFMTPFFPGALFANVVMWSTYIYTTDGTWLEQFIRTFVLRS